MALLIARAILAADAYQAGPPSGASISADNGVPLQSVESLEALSGERLIIANDNNYPSSDGRWTQRDRPDDTELIIVRVPALRRLGH